MVWIDNINQLEYWNPSEAPDGCYHDMLFSPEDLILQVPLFPAINNDYTIVIHALSTDGQTDYGDVTDHFLYYFFGVNVLIQGYTFLKNYCNIKLNTVPPEICTHKCFILHVTITSTVDGTVFHDKYTQAYEIDGAMCCVPITGVTINQDGQNIANACSIDVDSPIIEPNPCGKRWIAIRNNYPCLDKNTQFADFYGYPTSNMIWANDNYGPYPFKYNRFCWIEGIIRENPRETERIRAFNCSIQKITYVRKYQFQGTRTFPDWKKIDLEEIFSSPELYIDDKGIYDWPGGQLFSRPIKRFQFFHLNTILEECEKRQIFGCRDIDKCNPQAIFLAMKTLPATERYFDDNRLVIAESYEGLLAYLSQLDGVTAVEEVTIPDGEIACTFEKVVKVVGTGAAIPTMIYLDYPVAANRLYAKGISTDADGNLQYNELCNGRIDLLFTTPAPTFGTPVVEEVAVEAPTFGTPVIEDMTARRATITQEGDWVLSPLSDCVILGNVITLTISAFNETVNNDPLLGKHALVMEKIGTLEAAGRPAATVVMDKTYNALIPDATSIQIDPDGSIYWTGETITEDVTGGLVEFINLKYNKS